LRVAAGLLRDPRGRILVQQRLPGRHLAGLWEFPGGKCEPGETAAAALRREWQEELGVRVQAATRILSIDHGYADCRIRLTTFRIERWSGKPASCEGQPLRWVMPAELARLPLPAANGPIANAARLPPLYLISPDPESPARIPECVARVDRALRQGGLQLLQVRAPRLPRAAFLDYARALIGSAASRGAEVLVNAPAEWLGELPPTGRHLGQRVLESLQARPECAGWCAASVHDRESLLLAARLGVDFVVAGPVRPTSTHPGAPGIGMAAFAALCAQAPVPVYALGGLDATDLPAVQALGGQGVAAIRGLLD
jgi:8-oxo-dGTP diphosphatase